MQYHFYRNSLDYHFINICEKKVFIKDTHHFTTLSSGLVVPDGERCVQGGICSYSCPIGIDVRANAWENKSIQDSHSMTCGECVARCPSDVLHFERIKMPMENKN